MDKRLKRTIRAIKYNARHGIDIRTTLCNLGFWEVDSAKRVVELIHDNTQLMDECRELQNKVDNLQKYLDTKNCYRECAETWSKLTEAKYYIQKLLDCLRQDTNDTGANYCVAKYMNEAEQFLKDSEVEK